MSWYTTKYLQIISINFLSSLLWSECCGCWGCWFRRLNLCYCWCCCSWQEFRVPGTRTWWNTFCRLSRSWPKSGACLCTRRSPIGWPWCYRGHYNKKVRHKKYFLRPKKKGALGFFCTLKIQILGKGIAPLMTIGKIKLKIFPRFGRL